MNDSIKIVKLIDCRSWWSLRMIDIANGMSWEDRSVVVEEWDI